MDEGTALSRNVSKGKLFLYAILSLLLFYGLFKSITAATSKKVLYAELPVFVFLVVLTFAGFVLCNQQSGQKVFFFLFILHLANVLILWYTDGALYLTLLFAAVMGFVSSLPQRKKRPRVSEEPHSIVFDDPQNDKNKVHDKTPKLPQRLEAKKPEAIFSPGKYVASARGNVYHEPKCDWAKKIAEGRRIWFREKEEARKKGYKAHQCTV